MTLGIDRFSEFFVAANGRSPFPWQARLANQLFQSGWPACIDLPTASGKTACIDIAIFVAACQVNVPTEQRTVGRRVFFTVNRRVIVDEAFERSKSLAQKLLDAESQPTGILHDVAFALRSLNEETDPSIAPPLAIAQLRGGVYRDATWSRSLTQPMVVCTTVDQLGSRMLFRGYGVSDNALPIHAALCSHDATILLDEAHVTKAFCETLALLDRYQRVRDESTPIATPFRFVQMTATPQGEVEQPFQLGDEDYKNEVLRSRQTASKPASLISVDKKKSLSDRIAADAVEVGTAAPRAVGIIVNRVQTAREVAAKIERDAKIKGSGYRVHLVIGRMRPFDRDILQRDLRHSVGPNRPNVLDQSVYVVATQCLEVGADYDFDVLLTECASIDALRQRFGRLNRAGRKNEGGNPIEAFANIYFQPAAEKGDDPIYGTALTATWDWLHTNQDKDSKINFGITAFQGLWDQVSAAQRAEMSSPSSSAAILLPAHLDLLCQTSPRPTPEPEISYFIHGPQRSNADINVCWRADLGAEPNLWPDVVRLLPPTSLECMPVPIWTVRRWVAGQPVDKYRDTDVAVDDASQDPRHRNHHETQSKTVLLWRGMGDQTVAITDPAEIRPGDTIVISVRDGGWDVFGHIPGAPASDSLHAAPDVLDQALLQALSDIDIAEQCCRSKNLRHVVRIHPAFPYRLSLRSLPTNELREALHELAEQEFSNDSDVALDDVENQRSRQEKAAILDSLRRGLERHYYPRSDESSNSDDELLNEVVYCQTLMHRQAVLELPAPASDDEDDDRSQSSESVTLAEHTTHVVEQVRRAATKLNPRYSSVFEFAAMWHDLGKIDVRFQAMLSGRTPSESIERDLELAKSDSKRLTMVERDAIRRRSLLPIGFRHEFLSTQLVENVILKNGDYGDIEWELVLRLIESHHGYARPMAGVIIDHGESHSVQSNSVSLAELRSVNLRASKYWPEIELSGEERDAFVPLHRLDSGVIQRFWNLTRRFGWWGLAYVEAIQRLADQRASAAEEMRRA
jgi:CRISPR-associated endonuclease/helicase Cas3